MSSSHGSSDSKTTKQKSIINYENLVQRLQDRLRVNRNPRLWRTWPKVYQERKYNSDEETLRVS